MVSKTHWTIQDYLKQAGMGADLRRKTAAAPPGDAMHDFSRVLAESQAKAGKAGTGGGRRIADYLRTPLAAKAPRPYPRAAAVIADPGQAKASGSPPITGQGAEAGPQVPESVPVVPEIIPPSASEDGRLRQPVKAGQVSRQIDESIEKAAAAHGLPADLIRAVIQAESNFQVRAVSPAGAQGLMQLMPATARELGVNDPFDIGQNIDGGARYLRQMLDMFDGDLKQALSAYNAGPGTVMKYGGRVPYSETRHYVRKVMLYAKG